MQQKLPENLFVSGSILLITILIGGWIVIPLIVQNKMESELLLKNGTKLWEEWVNIKQVNFSIYIFNVSNPREIESGGEPVIQQIGPYVYSKITTRQIIQASTQNDTIIYKDFFTYHFNEELSKGKEEDEIMVVNVPFVAVAQQISTLSAFVRNLAASYLLKFKSEIFVRRTVGEYLFRGTYDPMMHELELLTDEVLMPNSTFGLFYGLNGTDRGIIEVHSGKDASYRLGHTVSWNGETKLNFWEGPYCNMMNGTDGTVYAPFFRKERSLFIFSFDLCRSFELIYSEEVEMNGVLGYKFLTKKNFMDAPKNNPDNRCYCSEEDIDKCFGAGVYSIRACRNDAPLIMSTPHFYDGEVAYAEKFGLQPDKDLHESQIVIEPRVGAPLNILLRIQLNADVKKLPKVAKFKAIQDMIFPLLWVEESFTLPEEKIVELQLTVYNPLKIIDFTRWFVVGCSLLLIVISGIIFMARTRRKPVFV